ncbi:MAG TPA: hypothetical protein VG097_09840, partial [Gemmata sp.]|nr:hypothetical protein [Gemmata sp.]
MSHEINEAVQNPIAAFSDVDLRTSEPVVGTQGLPLPHSGNFADVYQLRGADGRDWAVKCFTRPVIGLADRYAAISDALAQAGQPFTIGFTYLTEGIGIGGTWWPVVKMEWVEGLLLNQIVQENADRPIIMAVLGQMWVKLCRRLRESGIAHADLQHGNVLMVPGSGSAAYSLKLIDYDGMYVPALANQPSGESGHPAYQHPERNESSGYSPHVDRFPQLLIATALKGLEVCGRPLWDKYDTGDNLLFLEGDIKKPGYSKLMRELWQSEHSGLQSLVGRLAIASQRPISKTPWLDQIAPEGEPVPLDEETRRDAIQVLNLLNPIPVPLAPDPSFIPISGEDRTKQHPQPYLESIHRPFPKAKLATSPAKRQDTERSEAKSRRKKPKRKQKKQEKARAFSNRSLTIGGVLLLVGSIAVGIVLSGNNSKPQETTEIKSDPQNSSTTQPPKPQDPTPPSTPQPKPQDPTPPSTPQPKPLLPSMSSQDWITKLNRPGANVILPSERFSDPAAMPASKDGPRAPSDSDDTITTPPTPDPIKVSIRDLRRVKMPREFFSSAEFNDDGQRVVLTAQPQRLASYDLRTGIVQQLPDVPNGKGTIYHRTIGNRVAVWRGGQKSFAVSDLNTGLAVGIIPFPD